MAFPTSTTVAASFLLLASTAFVFAAEATDPKTNAAKTAGPSLSNAGSAGTGAAPGGPGAAVDAERLKKAGAPVDANGAATKK